jgi:hypothetical protein
MGDILSGLEHIVDSLKHSENNEEKEESTKRTYKISRKPQINQV